MDDINRQGVVSGMTADQPDNNKTGRKRHVFLTGATGTMGSATLKELAGRLDRFTVTLLARPSKKNRRMLAQYEKMEGISVIWGDLTNRDDVRRGVEGADFVLHVGGMVSPSADYYPEKTFKVNTTAMRLIVDAVKARPERDNVGVVYIGSVAQYGPYNPPHHWGRCGDPLNPALMDGYARSKVAAERILSDSGLRKWVSLRQTGILSRAMLFNGSDPIAFHVPVKGVLEWATAEDSGRLLANVCEEWVPECFWQRFYNIGGGASYRLTNYEFESMLMKALRCPPPEKVFDVRWFATDNFHGMWYADSDRLEELLHFRSDISAKDYFDRLARSLPWFFSLTPVVPAFVMKLCMRWVAGRNHLAPLHWKKHDNRARINAHFGSLEEWEALPGWEGTDLSRPSDTPELRPLGYDENKPVESLGIEDMRSAASFHGGRCLSEQMTTGDMITPLRWETAEGAEFTASPATILLGGHWGPALSSL